MEDNKAVVSVAKEILKEGFPMPRKPKVGENEEILWPRSVADLSPDELARHMTYWSAWAGFTRTLLAKASCNELAFDNDLGIFKSHYLLKTEGDHRTVTAAKAAVGAEPEAETLSENKQQSKIKKRLLRSLLETYEERYGIVSREISRRGTEFKETTRTRGRDDG